MLPRTSVALQAVSPTMCVRLACPARVAFSQVGGRPRTPPSDAAIIGSIVHRAIELAVKGRAVDDAWSAAVTESARRGEQPDTSSRVRRARLRYQMRVRDVLALIDGVDVTNVHCEQRLLSKDGSLEGTPDLVVVRHDGCDIVDFKTGLVTDLDEEMPKPDYARQIRIYAHLASEAHRVPAIRGVLLSFRQGQIDVDVSHDLIEQAVQEALGRRQAFNERVPGPQPAHAGDATCRWCEHQLICDGYWDAVADDSSGLAGSVLRGTICSVPERSQNGLVAVQVEVSGGARPGSVATIAEIAGDEATDWAVGDIISVTALRRRSPDHAVFACTARSTTHRERA